MMTLPSIGSTTAQNAQIPAEFPQKDLPNSLSSWGSATSKHTAADIDMTAFDCDNHSSFSEESFQIKDDDSPADVLRKQFIRRHISKKYYVTSDSLRYRLLKLLDSNNITIKKAAEILKINYSTAKSIVQIYKREGRICKKTINSRLSTPLSSILAKYEDNPNYRGGSDDDDANSEKSSAAMTSSPSEREARRYTTNEEKLLSLDDELDISLVSQKVTDESVKVHSKNLMTEYVQNFFNVDSLIHSRFLPVPSALFGKDLRTLDAEKQQADQQM